MTTTEMESQPLTEAELDELFEELEYAGRRFPKDAIRQAQKYRDQITPRLIEAIRRATQDVREGVEPEGRAHFFAIFLLTEFRVREAFPAILDAVSLPDDGPFELFGDAISEVLPRAFVTLSDDTADLLDKMIADTELNPFVRWEVAQAFSYLVRENRMGRKEAVERLRPHLREAMEQVDYEFTAYLISVLCSLCPREAYDDIKEAYEEDLVEAYIIDLGSVEDAIAEGEAGMRADLDRRKPTYIEDTVEELEYWAAFQEEPIGSWTPPFMPEPMPASVPAQNPDPDRDLVRVDPPSSGPPMPRAGRNEPCPCGSGKKFKKCCGSPKARNTN